MASYVIRQMYKTFLSKFIARFFAWFGDVSLLVISFRNECLNFTEKSTNGYSGMATSLFLI